MAIYFVKNTAIDATPADTNDGRDPIGFGLVDASKSVTSLTQTGAFSGYTHQDGDIIALTDGFDWTWYTIEAKVSDDELALGTSPLDGVDFDGTVDSSDGPFATIQQGVDTLASGDKLVVCNDGDYELDSTLNWHTAGGQNRFFAGTSRGDFSDALQTVTLKPSGSFTSGDQLTHGQVGDSRWRGFIFDADNTASQCLNASSNDARDVLYERCEFMNSTSYLLRTENNDHFFVLCAFHDSGSWAVRFGDGGHHLVACSFYNNSGRGIGTFTPSSVHARNCLFYNNGGKGIEHGGILYVEGCTFYGNSDSGILFDGTEDEGWVINSTFVNNGGYGVEFNNGNLPTRATILTNIHTHGNTSGATNLGDSVLGHGHVTGDPLFLDPDNGDFTVQKGSPILEAGAGAP